MSEQSPEELDISDIKLINQEDIRKQFNQLCAYRDAVEARIKPLRAQLDDARNVAEKARVYAEEIAAQLYEARGGKNWFILKKNICILAKMLGGR